MEQNIIDIWSKVLDMLKDEISLVAYKTYIEVMYPRFVDSNTICLLAPSIYHINVCKDKYLDLIENSLALITNKNYIIQFESKVTNIGEDSENNINTNININKPIDISNNNKQNTFVTNLNPKFTFDRFVVGTNNRFAYAAAVAVTENLNKKYNPLYIYGGVGLGKTHLMHAIGNEIVKYNKNLRVLVTSGETFTNELINSIMTKKNEAFRNKYRNIDVFLIDDIQFLVSKKRCQEEFFHTFEYLSSMQKQIIITSEKSPKELELDDRLITRFEMGLAVDITPPDYETRLAILRKKTQLERFIIDDDVLVKIATKVDSNVRELEGIFNKLVAYKTFTNSNLTDEIVDNTIETILVKNSKVLTSTLIMQVVAQYFNIRVSDLLSDKRSANISFPRQIVMFLCRNEANMSFPKIGKDLGGKDHSTIVRGYGKFKKIYDEDEETRNIVNEIKAKFNFKNS